MLTLEQKEARYKRQMKWDKMLTKAAKDGTLHMTAHQVAKLEGKAERWDIFSGLIEEIVEATMLSHEDCYHGAND